MVFCMCRLKKSKVFRYLTKKYRLSQRHVEQYYKFSTKPFIKQLCVRKIIARRGSWCNSGYDDILLIAYGLLRYYYMSNLLKRDLKAEITRWHPSVVEARREGEAHPKASRRPVIMQIRVRVPAFNKVWLSVTQNYGPRARCLNREYQRRVVEHLRRYTRSALFPSLQTRD